ncbi:MAG: hypothetical protein AMXMBFR13_51450 [Phycisphaerae bacterium]
MGINLCEIRDLQFQLTERMLAAADERLEELHADAGAHPIEIKSVKELADLAQTHLSDLRNSLGPEKVPGNEC